MSLRRRIDALCSAFASDVFDALRRASFTEIEALASRGPRAAAKGKAAAKGAKRTRSEARPNAPRPSRTRVMTARAEPSADVSAAALAFFASRGTKGATAAQVLEHLESSGMQGGDVVATLAARGAIRDAGIRRATGKGTSAVYVLGDAAAS